MQVEEQMHTRDTPELQISNHQRSESLKQFLDRVRVQD